MALNTALHTVDTWYHTFYRARNYDKSCALSFELVVSYKDSARTVLSMSIEVDPRGKHTTCLGVTKGNDPFAYECKKRIFHGPTDVSDALVSIGAIQSIEIQMAFKRSFCTTQAFQDMATTLRTKPMTSSELQTFYYQYPNKVNM